ncbi:FG-GAP-like repeat-containing protein [Streptomyces sp. ICBB 8177]|uniref:trypsin-like serine peptidase n=1 Tax=Streptomyces sp. ICBB 8177 TaxID=563922 RepID=UPI001F540C67|nr:FG-GAP-like repeat-containing protein [Streptomyces sp. ICBB 8177]
MSSRYSRRSSRLAALAAVCAAVLGLTGAQASAASPAHHEPAAPSAAHHASGAAASRRPAADPGAKARAAASYWTAQRMANARPLDARTGGGMRPMTPKGAGVPQGTFFRGTPLVGTFFGSDGPTGTDWTCTGSVIDTPARDVILTAAHCGLGIHANYVFVPDFVMGAAPAGQPYGIFPVQQVYIDPRYTPDPGSHTTKGPTSDLDTAFATLAPNQKGQQVQDAVGGGLTFTEPTTYDNPHVTVVGYPAYGHNPNGSAIKCTVPTTQLPGFRQMSMTCGGYYGGVSGSPWITDYADGATSGHVIGDLGGYNGGGNDQDVNYISYGTYFGSDAAALLARAVAGQQQPPTPLPPYTGLQPKLPGGAALWKHAKLLASGDFTGDHHGDLVVVWDDGEVTLYPGDGNGGFLPEKQLKAPNAAWKQAATITAGDFAGSGQYDLMVRWADGHVSLFPDLGSSGLGHEVVMAKPGSAWKNAAQITGGQFHNGSYVSDLLVRWSNGEVDVYTGVGANTFGTKHRLLAPNATWKYAVSVAAGHFGGAGANWDVAVRWIDGELDVYPATSQSRLGTEHRLLNANARWKSAAAMTVGAYTANASADDILARWPDGSASLFQDTTPATLGGEQSLVFPGA